MRTLLKDETEPEKEPEKAPEEPEKVAETEVEQEIPNEDDIMALEVDDETEKNGLKILDAEIEAKQVDKDPTLPKIKQIPVRVFDFFSIFGN